MKIDAIEIMCSAHWDRHALRKWADIPEEWKPFYRESMRAAVAAAGILLENPTFDNLDKTP